MEEVLRPIVLKGYEIFGCILLLAFILGTIYSIFYVVIDPPEEFVVENEYPIIPNKLATFLCRAFLVLSLSFILFMLVCIAICVSEYLLVSYVF